VKSVNHPAPPDWLKEHRLELGFKPDPVVHQPRRLLLLKGGLLAVVLVFIPFAALFLLETQQRRLELEVRELAPVESRLGDAQTRLKAMAQERASLSQKTSRIAAQLVALRSGSALLEQMRQATPQGVRLLSLAALPSKLVITGEAEGADAFERINALALNLENLDDFLLDGTRVVKATSNDDGLINFSLESALDSSAKATPERLRDLGSKGLARRYEILQEKGIAL
jgi:type IV pilus assembly protein PilN